MVDIDLVVNALRSRGHSVETVYPVPENAGDWEFSVDGTLMPLEEVRHLLEQDDSRQSH
jgi:hypothetical protein